MLPFASELHSAIQQHVACTRCEFAGAEESGFIAAARECRRVRHIADNVVGGTDDEGLTWVKTLLELQPKLNEPFARNAGIIYVADVVHLHFGRQGAIACASSDARPGVTLQADQRFGQIFSCNTHRAGAS